MKPGQILVVSDDSKFVQSLTASWRETSDSPCITAVSIDVSRQASPVGYPLVVVGPVRQGSSLHSLPIFSPDSLVCVVGEVESLKGVRAKGADWLFLPEYPGWAMVLFCVAREVSRRMTAEARAREAETTTLLERRLGVLGKSLLEARPGMINALTSLLGNADLVLLSEEALPADSREPVRTIHKMALRLSQSIQRLTSFEEELELAERKSHVETPRMRLEEASKI